jgi:hypothetical protein
MKNINTAMSSAKHKPLERRCGKREYEKGCKFPSPGLVLSQLLITVAVTAPARRR